jgi:hypothetical protein
MFLAIEQLFSLGNGNTMFEEKMGVFLLIVVPR